jgi:hypothetical protein
MEQSRWKSPMFWTLITGQIIALLVIVGAFDAIGLDVTVVEKVVALVIELVFSVVNGINNPTNKTGW